MTAKRHEITVDTLLEDLEADRQLAHRAEQSGGAVTATMSKARLLGLVVDRKESGAPGEFANMQSIQEVIAVVRRELGDQAADALGGLLQADTVPEPTHEAGDAVN
jgi:hypothetical protein